LLLALRADQAPDLTADGVHDEEDVAVDRADNLPSLFGVFSSLVHSFDAKWIGKDLQCIHEVDAMLDEVGFPLSLVPLECRFRYTESP